MEKKELVSLQDHDKAARAIFIKERHLPPNGIRCDACAVSGYNSAEPQDGGPFELVDAAPGTILENTYPPRTPTFCPNCGATGDRLVTDGTWDED